MGVAGFGFSFSAVQADSYRGAIVLGVPASPNSSYKDMGQGH
jgi:hypothetical protein